MATVYLYTRVSTDKQSVDTQEHDLLKRFPEGVIIKETASGVKARPELEKLLATVKPGDTIAVAALDRLGRKLTEILTKIEALYHQGINVVSLRENVDYRTPMGKLVTQVLMSVAELERNLISERTTATLQAMKARGVKLGRPNTHPQEKVDEALFLRRNKKLPLHQIAKITGISKSRLGEIFKAHAERFGH